MARPKPDPPMRVNATGRGLPQRIPLSPSAMAEDDPKQKMRAFDDEVALTVAPFYLVHMLQRTLPAGFIAPCLPTKTDKLPSGGLSDPAAPPGPSEDTPHSAIIRFDRITT